VGLTAKRRTFVVGPDGKIARVWPAVKVEGHADEVLSAIQEFVHAGSRTSGAPVAVD
jgi:peroxiredoxin